MNNWKRAEKKLPDTDRQVLALAGSCAYLVSYRDGYWWMTHTIKLGGVTRWMDMPGEPKDLAYWTKRLCAWWSRRKEKGAHSFLLCRLLNRRHMWIKKF